MSFGPEGQELDLSDEDLERIRNINFGMKPCSSCQTLTSQNLALQQENRELRNKEAAEILNDYPKGRIELTRLQQENEELRELVGEVTKVVEAVQKNTKLIRYFKVWICIYCGAKDRQPSKVEHDKECAFKISKALLPRLKDARGEG